MANLTAVQDLVNARVRSDLGADLQTRILSLSKDAHLHRFDTKAASFDRLRMLRCPQIRMHPGLPVACRWAKYDNESLGFIELM